MEAAGGGAPEALMPPRKRARGEVGVSAETPQKSPNDKLAYRLLSFPNGFEALLVSSDDNKKNKAAAAMAVGAGSFSDPPERCEGLAHYLEHMLFMGSVKYPGEDEMEKFLSQNGGYSNAFTESAHTCYYFEVNKAHLHKVLDMLAQFFIAPLLKTDSAERELDAIDSEFRLTQNSDSSRVAQLFAHFARPGHPFRLFGWGNRHSLVEAPQKVGVDVNKELRAFHTAHYRAPRLRLCVFGVEPLDSLEEAVLTSFEGLPAAAPAEARHGPQEALLTVAGRPFAEADLPKVLRVRPVKDTHKLSMSWQLPPSQHLYRSKPVHYLQHLVGHEGVGSLLSLLKEEGLAVQLTAGVGEDDFECNSMCSIFSMDITLTVKGLEKWPEVAHAVFLYLDMLRREGPQRWVHEEMVLTQDMGWRFLEETNPTDYVENLSCQLLPVLDVERQHVLRAPWMTPNWDPDAITAFLGDMLPNRCMLNILSSAYGRANVAKTSGEVEGEEAKGQSIGSKESGVAGGDDRGEKEDEDEEGEEEEGEGDEEEEVEDEAGSEADASGAKDPSFDATEAGPPTLEPHFGTEFWEASQAEVQELLAAWEAEPAAGSRLAKAKGALRLPDRNHFIATDFELRPPPAGEDPARHPLLTTEPEALRARYPSFPPMLQPLPQRPRLLPARAGMRAWHLQDTVFCTPRSELWLKLSTDEAPLLPRDTKAMVLLSLLGRTISDVLNETAYLAEQASLNLHISSSTYGLDLSVGGFSHKLPTLLEVGLQECLAFGDPATWERRSADQAFHTRLQAQHEQLLRSYRNAYMKPGDHAADLRRVLVMPHKKAAPERARVLEGVDEQEVASFAQALVPKLRAEVLYTGNTTIAEAEALVQNLPQQLRADPEALPRQPSLPVAVVPSGKATVLLEDSPDTGSRVAAVELYFQMGVAGKEDFKERAVLDLLEALMSEPLFDTLRTKQQLGYVASCGIRVTHQVLGYSIWLLSSKVGPAEICCRVEAFLLEFKQFVKDLPAEDFERHVSSLAAQKLEPDRTLVSVQEGAWAELQERRCTFDRHLLEAVALASVSREDVLGLLDRCLLAGAGERRLLVVAVLGGRAKGKKATELEAFRINYPGCWQISSQAEFLAGTSLFENLF